MANKKVYFYQMSLYGVTDKMEVDYTKIKDIFISIIDKNALKHKKYMSLDVTLDEDPLHTVIDIFDYKNSRLFCRLSKQKPSSSVIQREYTTYEKEDVLPDDDEQERGIEQYTYGFLDYNKAIFSIVSSLGAPNEKCICNAFLKYAHGYYLELVPIPNEKGIDAIYTGEKSEITRVEIEVPCPSAEVLEGIFEWKEKDIINTIAERHLSTAIVLKPLHKQSITMDENETKGLIDCIKEKLPVYTKAKIRAKAKNVRLRDYNLYDENFSYPIDISVYHMGNYERIYYTVDELVEIYKQNLVFSYQQNLKILSTITGR